MPQVFSDVIPTPLAHRSHSIMHAVALVYDAVHCRLYVVRMHTDLMSSYQVMRIDYVRIPHSFTYDRNHSDT